MRNALTSLLLLAGLTTIATAQGSPPPPDDRLAAGAAMGAMSRHAHDAAPDPHLRMTTSRPATPEDAARAADIVSTVRRALARYRDVNAARADGYQEFLPGVALPVSHFTNRRSALEAVFSFDAGSPTSLLYRKHSDGSYSLAGVMYTAPARLGEKDLDKRIPLSITRWHQHVNWCLPKRGDEARWTEMRGGKPLFGPEGPIVTQAACDAVSGRFLPRIFGWMVHVNAFASDDPRVIWGNHH